MQGRSEKSGATFVAQCQTCGKHPVKTSSLLQGWGEALPCKPKSLSLDPSNLHKAGYGSLDLESQLWGGRSRMIPRSSWVREGRQGSKPSVLF